MKKNNDIVKLKLLIKDKIQEMFYQYCNMTNGAKADKVINSSKDDILCYFVENYMANSCLRCLDTFIIVAFQEYSKGKIDEFYLEAHEKGNYNEK